MKKFMIVLMLFGSFQIVVSSEFENFKVPSSWTVDDIFRALKNPGSDLNRYLNYHAEPDESMAKSLGAVQTVTQESEAFKARQQLREEKRLLHLE